MGRPSFRSDVFSLGLIIYRMLTGYLPEWPFRWPPPGYEKLRGRVHPQLIEFIRRALQLNPRARFRDADQMLKAFRRIKPRALAYAARRAQRAGRAGPRRDWRAVRISQFRRQYGRVLEAQHECRRCSGPIAEVMFFCPWCGAARPVHRGPTRFTRQCPRCRRGLKADWRFCPWCYGPGFEPATNRHYSDVRYQARCSNPRCPRKLLMPFMRYCPWCRRKVRRHWSIPNSTARCPRCHWGILTSFWDYCPWCGASMQQPNRRTNSRS